VFAPLKTISIAVALAALPALAAAADPAYTLAQATPAPAPAPSATPSGGLADPCNGILAFVNRPTFSTGACTIKRGMVMLETGYTNQTNSGAGANNIVTYPNGFVRVGTSKNLELEFTPPSLISSSGPPRINGATDTTYGLKWEAGYTSKLTYGLSASATLKTGSPAFTELGTSYNASFNYSYTLTPVFSLFGSFAYSSLVGTNPISGANQRFGSFAPSLGMTAALPGSQQLFFEYANIGSAGPSLGGRSLYDFGYQAVLTPHLMVDVEYGASPTAIAGSKFSYTGFGISYLFFR
jgi:hypothetical protein